MPIPTVLVSGALGSGKTTLLKSIVAANPDRKFGVVVNEFGEMGIDGDLLRPLVPEIVEIRNGCICCATQDQLVPAIKELLRIYNVDVLLLEMSGAAEVMPVLSELRVLAPLIEISSHTVLIDATSEIDSATRERAFRSAIANADVLVITKADLARPRTLSLWDSFLASFNVRAHVVHASHGAVELDALLSVENKVSDDVQERPTHSHDAASHRLTSVCQFVDAITQDQLRSFVERFGDKITRIKGIARVNDVWSEVQVVRGDLRIVRFDGSAPSRGRIVFISGHLYQHELCRAIREYLLAGSAETMPPLVTV